jgi:hypothetical protein
MKNLKLKTMNPGVLEILTREQLKKVMGADGSGSDGSGGRCSDDRLCSMYGGWDGGCKTMATGQCRCVKYKDGVAIESVPSSYCLA